MKVKVTTFSNPFSFYCLAESIEENVLQHFDKSSNHPSNELLLQHGHYIAVYYKGHWTRGVVSLEKTQQIWLIDYGIFLRPNEKTVYVDLPVEYKKIPSKVFEASIHGVVPIDKMINVDCEIANQTSKTWNLGAINRVKDLLAKAKESFFQPLTLLSTPHNDIVLGDLYLIMPDKKIVNVVDELEAFPVFLKRSEEAYFQGIPIYYKNHRLHRACTRKPNFPDLPYMDVTNFDHYQHLCASSAAPEFVIDVENSSTTTYEDVPWTSSDVKRYIDTYFSASECDLETHSVLVNKMNDLAMCEECRDYEGKGVGRGMSRSRNALVE